MLGVLLAIIYLVFDLDQTLLELFKVGGYTGKWVEKGHIVPVHAYIRVLCRRLGYRVKTSGTLRTGKKPKNSRNGRNFVKSSVLVVVELVGEIMDTIIYNGGNGGSLINGLFNSDKINLNKLKDAKFVKSVKFLEPLVIEFFDLLEKSTLTFEDVIEITNQTLTGEERLFFSQCSRKAMPKQNSEKYIALNKIFLDIEKYNAIASNNTKILIGMFSAGDGYMLDFLKQSGLERFFQFAVDFGSENELRGAFDFQDENGTYPNVRCKSDHETFATVDTLIMKSITNYCTKNNLQITDIDMEGIKVKMIDDNPKVCLATTEYGKISQLMWEPVNIEKITSVGKSENPTKGTLFYTQNQIVDLIKGLLSSV
jgi:hypothetical protein